MRSYIFRVVHRRPDGVIGPSIYEHIIVAADDATAIEEARTLDLDMTETGANAMYLAASDGRAVWSLHIDMRPAED